MIKLKTIAASITLLAATGMYTTAMADTAHAKCELYKRGELNRNASGHCIFSQRQGYVDITLRNGHTFNLNPGNQANHFEDQKGNRVVRSNEGNGAQRYKWDHKRLIVSFNKGNNNTGNRPPKYGETPHNLRDLIGQRGGEAEDKLQNRGFVLMNSSKSDGSVYSHWRERKTGYCVALRSDAHTGLYKSIVYSMEFDCKR